MGEPALQPETILILSQVYVPDPASVGQHMADAAAELARRGRRVVVLTARRGYEDPSRRYLARERRDGVEVRRLLASSFGKRGLALRLLAGWIFVAQCIVHGLTLRGLSVLVVSTTPPFCPLAALVIAALRRCRVVFWCMDLNVDLLVAQGRLRPGGAVAWLAGRLDRAILRRADRVVALDRFMAEKLRAKADPGDRLTVLPPWPHEDHLESLPHAVNPFRREHGLDGRFVLMFSGNLGMGNPIDTVLEAAARLRDHPRLLFVFIGGGSGKRLIEEILERDRPVNLRLLPYQPLEAIKYSLSAADVHLVSVGNELVGLSHPCKIYGAMAVARPILFLGPKGSHVGDVLARHEVGWRVDHGDVESAVRTLRTMADAAPAQLAAMGERARRCVAEEFSRARLLALLCEAVEGSPIAEASAVAFH